MLKIQNVQATNKILKIEDFDYPERKKTKIETKSKERNKKKAEDELILTAFQSNPNRALRCTVLKHAGEFIEKRI